MPLGGSVGVAPLDGQWHARKRRGGIAIVGEDIAGVVEDNIKNHVKPGLMGGIHQRAQFVVGVGRLGREKRLRPEKIVDAVAVIAAAVKRKVLQHRAEPDGAGSQALDIAELLLDPGKLAALILVVIRVIERLMGGRPRDC